MILPLRRAHRRAMLALPLVAAAGLAAAFAAHPASAPPSPAPAALAALERPPLPAGAHLLGESRVWSEPLATVRLYAVPAGGPVLLELQSQAPAPAQPDELVYWSPAGDDLEQAWLLGPAPAGTLRRYPLPEAARAGGGRLLLWSLGHHALVAAGSLPEAPR